MPWLNRFENDLCLRNCNDVQCRSIERTAADGRIEMQALNDRLATYLTRVQQMQTQQQPALSGYGEAVQGLEEELANLKRFYDAEINRLRSLLEGTMEQKTSLMARTEQLTIANNGNQASAAEELARSQVLAADLERMRVSFAQAQKEIADLRNNMQARDTEFASLRSALERFQRENRELRFKLESEMAIKIRKLEEENLRKDQLQFDSVSRDQMLQDLEKRLRVSSEIIVSLEMRINQMTQNDTRDVSSLVKNLREGTVAELKRYQQESEGALNRSLKMLHVQIEEEARAKDSIGQQKTELENQVHQQLATIVDLEAKVNALTQQRLATEKTLSNERARSQSTIADLERRLKELQCSAMCKVQECTAAQDAQLALKAEIDTFKSVMENEEHQLSQVLQPVMKIGFSTSGSYNRKSYPQTPPSCQVINGLHRSGSQLRTQDNQRYKYGSFTDDSMIGYGETIPRVQEGWAPNQQKSLRVSIDTNPYQPIRYAGRGRSGVSGALCW